MYMTKSLVEKVGKRHPMIRSAMVQAGDKVRIQAMKKALLSIGVCELTQKDMDDNDFIIKEKKYSFCAEPLTYVLLDAEAFKRFKPISSAIKLEVAHIQNGVIGIKREIAPND